MSEGIHVTSELRTISLGRRCVALMAYDHLLTLDMERRVIWGSKCSIPTALFLTNRYTLWLFCLSSILSDLVPWNSAKVRFPSG